MTQGSALRNMQNASGELQKHIPLAAPSKKIQKLDRKQLIGGVMKDADHDEGMLAHTFSKENLKQKFKDLKPCERVDVLYMHLIHNLPSIEIAKIMELNYKTVTNCIKAFKEHQRIFKLITKQTKLFLLK